MNTSALLAILSPIAVIQTIRLGNAGAKSPDDHHNLGHFGARGGPSCGDGHRRARPHMVADRGSRIAVIFEVFPSLYFASRVVGAAYLNDLGIGPFRAARCRGVFTLIPDAASPATTAPFRTAYLVMMTNPKVCCSSARL